MTAIFFTRDPCLSKPCKQSAQYECKAINGFSHECVDLICHGGLCCGDQLCCFNGHCDESLFNGTNFENCQCLCDENFGG